MIPLSSLTPSSSSTNCVEFADAERSFVQRYVANPEAAPPMQIGGRRRITEVDWVIRGDRDSVRERAQAVAEKEDEIALQRTSGPWWEARVTITSLGEWQPLYGEASSSSSSSN